jgi:oxygen-independent coproporphyrinogen-3 oxidase
MADSPDSPRRVIPIQPQAVSRPLPEQPQLTAPPPLSLYVHYPWCVRKCPYCDFNSHGLKQEGETVAAELEDAYIDALIADIQAALPQVWGRRIQTVFIGGGTPSLMRAASLDRFLTAVRMLLPLDPLVEITLEANPGTFEVARFRDYRQAGVNRLSLGVQSFDDTFLQRLGRIHGGHEARAAVEHASQLFERVNIDLMYALPGQGLDQALADVEQALALGVGHLSCYHLTLEPNTAFYRHPPQLPDADLAADMQDAIEARLAAAGFVHYETSAFARPGQQARHNLNYWMFGDYLGIGAGAHGKLSSHAGIVREMRHKHPMHYLDAAQRGDWVQERHAVGVADLPFEFMMNALRLRDGVPQALFVARTGLPLVVLAEPLAAAREQGLLDTADGWFRPTEKGRLFLNDLLTLFLNEGR